MAVMPGESRPDAGTFGPAAAAAAQQAQQGGIGIGVGDPGPERVPLNAAELEAVCDEMGVPPNMRSRFLRLAVLQPNLPIPMPTLVSTPSRKSDQDRCLAMLTVTCDARVCVLVMHMC